MTQIQWLVTLHSSNINPSSEYFEVAKCFGTVAAKNTVSVQTPLKKEREEGKIGLLWDYLATTTTNKSAQKKGQQKGRLLSCPPTTTKGDCLFERT
ncbi:hypothetical protein Pelo_3026 [Pelomyxa schiedti]|nr:hypothetical protein Pelo_3026 [Pelomyxa schiedti]